MVSKLVPLVFAGLAGFAASSLFEDAVRGGSPLAWLAFFGSMFLILGGVAVYLQNRFA